MFKEDFPTTVAVERLNQARQWMTRFRQLELQVWLQDNKMTGVALEG